MRRAFVAASVLVCASSIRSLEVCLKKPKRKLAQSGKFAKDRMSRERIRHADDTDDTVSHERMMRGRDNEAALPEGASQAELAGASRRGQIVAVRGPLLVVAPESIEPGESGAPSERPENEVAREALVECMLRKSTRVPHTNATAAVVGDFVSYLAQGNPPYSLTEVVPRRSRLARVRDGEERVICANVDLGVILASADDPSFKPRLVDRTLIAISDGGLDPVLVLNKADLVSPATIDSYLEPYAPIGVATIAVSARTGAGLDRLAETLKGRSSVFFGQSGVGKSTLVNALVPDLEARVGEIQEHTGKGRHTTTTSTLYRLPFGGFVIDTPGVRSFGVGAPSPNALAAFFPEIVEAAATCRFGNCRHKGDMGCAIPAAIRAGTIRPERLDSYLDLIESP